MPPAVPAAFLYPLLLFGIGKVFPTNGEGRSTPAALCADQDVSTPSTRPPQRTNKVYPAVRLKGVEQAFERTLEGGL